MRSKLRNGLFTAGLVATLSFTVACGGSNTAGQAPRAETSDAYSILRVEGDEAEAYGSLKEMARAADTVVIGKFVSFGVSRTVQSDAVQDNIVYGKATFQVTRQVTGKPVNAEVPVEFLLPYAADEAARRAGEFNATLPQGEVLVFLRAKRGAGEAGFYRLVNSEGLWTTTQRAALDTPLAEDAPAKDSRYKNELTGVGSINQLADQVTRG